MVCCSYNFGELTLPTKSTLNSIGARGPTNGDAVDCRQSRTKIASGRGRSAGSGPRAESGETVLVVDDEPTVRMLVTEILEELGYTAIEASDGAAGLRVLQSNARIDLLVTVSACPAA